MQKPYLRTNYSDSSFEENKYLKNQRRIENVSCLVENTDAVCKLYLVDSG